jgi:hypothetical protein
LLPANPTTLQRKEVFGKRRGSILSAAGCPPKIMRNRRHTRFETSLITRTVSALFADFQHAVIVASSPFQWIKIKQMTAPSSFPRKGTQFVRLGTPTSLPPVDQKSVVVGSADSGAQGYVV